jgi:hypothetical protein
MVDPVFTEKSHNYGTLGTPGKQKCLAHIPNILRQNLFSPTCIIGAYRRPRSFSRGGLFEWCVSLECVCNPVRAQAHPSVYGIICSGKRSVYHGYPCAPMLRNNSKLCHVLLKLLTWVSLITRPFARTPHCKDLSKLLHGPVPFCEGTCAPRPQRWSRLVQWSKYAMCTSN